MNDINLNMNSPRVGIIMGSDSDLEVMKKAAIILEELGIAFEIKVVSAHRTPERMVEYAKTSKTRGIEVIIAGAGGAAHLPGMVASMTQVPVIGVPVKLKELDGLDSLLSIVQMPGGVPVATVAIGKAGATNAGLLALEMLSMTDGAIADKLDKRRIKRKEKVMESSDELV